MQIKLYQSRIHYKLRRLNVLSDNVHHQSPGSVLVRPADERDEQSLC